MNASKMNNETEVRIWHLPCTFPATKETEWELAISLKLSCWSKKERQVLLVCIDANGSEGTSQE
jgi:hypothetical protein